MNDKCELFKKNCVPCRGGIPPLKGDELKKLLDLLGGGWKIVDEHHLEKSYSFNDFVSALDFTNKVGKLAEEEGHHPDIFLSYGMVKIKLWTHKINGLSESDFILAAKCDKIL